MSHALVQDLSWLPAAPEDFRARCRGLADAPGDLGQAVRRLATHALDVTQLQRLGTVLDGLKAQGRSLKPLTPFKLGLIGAGTLDVVAQCLVASAARHGLDLELVTADYGQVAQEAFSPDSAINRARCDAVLLALDHRGLPFPAVGADDAGAAAAVERVTGHLDSLRAALRANGGAVCLVQTVAPPAEPLFGSLDRAVAGTPRQLIEAVNAHIARTLHGSGDVLVDVAALAETVGLANWHSPSQWNLAKLPFADAFVPAYADVVARLLGALRGKARRALVLDLDNTLWGGVIGDDGLDGIALAEGDAVGEAYLSVQRLALALRARGVVLAVSSKNDDAVARRVFREHPEMLLKEEHIAVFQANWNDKATNIKAIAEELSLGLESFVFLDDNPVERGLVREILPEVAVPELPADPALYARTLALAGYFEAVAFSAEDRGRADFYQGNAQRLSLSKQAGDVAGYLVSLDMEIAFQPFEPASYARISQLINKSNQFNLTTRRYTEAEVAQMADDPALHTLQVRLADMFGDNGMIGVAICRPAESGVWEIDTWLMSCRVLGRGVETMVLRELVLAARERGVGALRGVYRPTDRNGMVREHYRKLGFAEAGGGADGETRWTLDVATEIEPVPMRVKRMPRSDAAVRQAEPAAA